jgi:catechol 2,3-dioxygenase
MGDVAHLGHVEVYTDRFDESLDFFTRVYGLKLSGQDETSAYLRAWDDYEYHSLKLTRHHTTGVGHIGYRVESAAALERRVAAITASGYKVLGWVDGDKGHGRAFRFEDPFGHVFELYWETVKLKGQGTDAPALKNTASAFTGAAPRRLDHLNLLSSDVAEFRRFMETCLGSKVTEMIQLDNGRIGGAWFTMNNKTYDLACTEEHGGGHARLHHVTYATDQREDILRAADIFLQNGVHIETGPHLLPVCLGTRGQPGGTCQRRRPADPGPRLAAGGLDRNRAQEGPGLGVEDDRDLPHPRHSSGQEGIAHGRRCPERRPRRVACDRRTCPSGGCDGA